MWCDVIRICARELGVVVVGVISEKTGLTWYFLSIIDRLGYGAE